MLLREMRAAHPRRHRRLLERCGRSRGERGPAAPAEPAPCGHAGSPRGRGAL